MRHVKLSRKRPSGGPAIAEHKGLSVHASTGSARPTPDYIDDFDPAN
jgi:hypothetical protein